MGIKEYLVDLEKESYLTSAGSVISKTCTVSDDLSIEEIKENLIYGDAILGKNSEDIFTIEPAEVIPSRKRIVAVGFGTVDSHYYLEKYRKIKVRDKRKYRVTVDLSGIATMVLSQLIVKKQFKDFTGIVNSPLIDELSPILTLKSTESTNLLEEVPKIFDEDVHLEQYKYLILNNIKQEEIEYSLGNSFLFTFLTDFYNIYYRMKLNVFMQLNRKMRAVSLGINDLLFDTNDIEFNIIIKYRDIIKTLPFTVEEY